jgi:signal transduction histidine kinase
VKIKPIPKQNPEETLESIIDGRVNKLVKANARLRKQIGKRIQVEKELLKSREQLRELSSHLQFIREEERKTVAREIHDELGQALTALKYDSSWLIDRLSEGQEDLQEKIKSMMEIIDSTIQRVKRISSELRPGILDDLGIVDAIEWQAHRFRDATGISCDFYSDINGLILDPSQSTTVFRIFQEALTNVARHAEATKVDVLLAEENNKVILRVRDNGKGIEENQISDHKSLGLLGMKERAFSCKGDLKIRGFRGHGTVVTLSIPTNAYMMKLVWSPLTPLGK